VDLRCDTVEDGEQCGGVKAREVEVPSDIRDLDPLDNSNYDYACEVQAAEGDGRSAEEWARATFASAPLLLRWFILVGWRVGLGLRLESTTSPSYVLGWKVLSATPRAAVLGVDSFVLTARLVVNVDHSKVIHATFVRYDRPLARLLWAFAAPIHRRVIPYLLNRAAAKADG
jgi:hypothetical protein